MEINSEKVVTPYPVSIIMDNFSDINNLSRLIQNNQNQLSDINASDHIQEIVIIDNQIKITTDQGLIFVDLIKTEPDKITYKLNVNNLKNFNEMFIIFNADTQSNTLWLTINVDIPYVVGLMLKPKIKNFMDEINKRLSESITL
ncbi:MAG: hypothetical protein PHF55_05280 [Bacteroidales bacterium]|jgi:hypothetical protein|nr:hypothetical protein [Bacteroidales bacterium]MDI3480057.1 hypothetical protein [Rikenellaceae bacterium]MDI3545741.1 hypothetical protein [Rikenellaceae bacterium]MDN5356257.1 hypothetical protein [Rikenellaceae bacterium]